MNSEEAHPCSSCLNDLFWLPRRPRPITELNEFAPRCRRFNHIPSLSDTITRAMALANNPQCDLHQYAELIQRDGAIAATVLRLANSVVYGGRHRTASLKQAVVRLGIGSCSQLLAAIGMRGLIGAANGRTRQICDILLKHGTFVACLAQSFNNRLELGFDGEEFTAGLLHDLGRILLAIAAPDDFLRADPMTFDEGEDCLADERKMLETDHCRIGAEYGAKNGFPEPVLNCIRYHHSPQDARKDVRLARLIALVDHLANYLQCTGRYAGYPWEHNRYYFELAGGWGRIKRQEMLDQVPAMICTAIRQSRAMLKAQA
jgi:putative nucleotidyltransferase with HDIG domain